MGCLARAPENKPTTEGARTKNSDFGASVTAWQQAHTIVRTVNQTTTKPNRCAHTVPPVDRVSGRLAHSMQAVERQRGCHLRENERELRDRGAI
jgi:hypothetical protein